MDQPTEPFFAEAQESGAEMAQEIPESQSTVSSFERSQLFDQNAFNLDAINESQFLTRDLSHMKESTMLEAIGQEQSLSPNSEEPGKVVPNDVLSSDAMEVGKVNPEITASSAPSPQGAVSTFSSQQEVLASDTPELDGGDSEIMESLAPAAQVNVEVAPSQEEEWGPGASADHNQSLEKQNFSQDASVVPYAGYIDHTRAPSTLASESLPSNLSPTDSHKVLKNPALLIDPYNLDNFDYDRDFPGEFNHQNHLDLDNILEVSDSNIGEAGQKHSQQINEELAYRQNRELEDYGAGMSDEQFTEHLIYLNSLTNTPSQLPDDHHLGMDIDTPESTVSTTRNAFSSGNDFDNDSRSMMKTHSPQFHPQFFNGSAQAFSAGKNHFATEKASSNDHHDYAHSTAPHVVKPIRRSNCPSSSFSYGAKTSHKSAMINLDSDDEAPSFPINLDLDEEEPSLFVSDNESSQQNASIAANSREDVVIKSEFRNIKSEVDSRHLAQKQFKQHPEDQQNIVNNFSQSKPLQGIKKEKEAKLQTIDLTASDNETSYKALELGVDTPTKPRNISSTKRQRKPKATARKTTSKGGKNGNKNCKRQKASGLTGDDEDFENDEEEEDGDDEYETRNVSSKKRHREQNVASKSNKRSKTKGSMAKTAWDYWQKRNMSHPRKDWGRAYKEVMFEVFASEKHSTTKRRAQAKKNNRFDTSSLFQTAPQAQDFDHFQNQDDDDGSEALSTKKAFEYYCSQDKKLNAKDKSDLIKASITFGFNRMSPVGKRKWRLKNMPTLLLHYQMMGVAQMLERECYGESPHGTVVADDMGLGKTIQGIAIIIANPPNKEQKKASRTATLIVVPSGLIKQWLREIRKHSGDNLDVIIFKSGREDVTTRLLCKHDIVLTTYHELRKSLPNPDKETIRGWVEQELDLYEAHLQWAKEHPQHRGLLHQVHWQRIIIDEGHNIKNYKSRLSRAAVHLEGDYRHLMSGTPIMKSFFEFYAAFKFLREPITMELTPAQFKLKFCDEKDPKCAKMMGCLFSDFLFRRRATDKILDNKPLVLLPRFQHKIRNIPLRFGERLVLEAFLLALNLNSSMQFEDGDPRKSLQSPYVVLLRSRQFLASPEFVAPHMMAVFTIEQMQDIQKLIKPKCHPRDAQEFHNVLYKLFSDLIEKKNDKGRASMYANDLRCCEKCKQSCDYLFQIKCKHIICQICLDSIVEEDDDDLEEGARRCPMPLCTKPFTESNTKLYMEQAKRPKQSSARKPERNLRSALNAKAKDYNGFRPVPAPHQVWVSERLERLDKGEVNILRSAKIEAVVHQIQYWLKKEPNTKIIVFSQFVHFQLILGAILEDLDEPAPFLYISGGQTSKEKDEAVQEFSENPKVKIMIAGLMCAGVGLNLTIANRIIISDPWWNSCVDNQAFGRVYRMGQNRKTFMIKTVVDDSVDSKIMKLQQKKETSIGKILLETLPLQEVKELIKREKYKRWDELINDFSSSSSYKEAPDNGDWRDDDEPEPLGEEEENEEAEEVPDESDESDDGSDDEDSDVEMR